MKIWVIGRNYPTKSNNNQGSFELEQAKMLAKRGNDVTYIACVLHPFWRINNGGYISFYDEILTVVAYSGFFTPHITNPILQFPYFPNIRRKRWQSLLKLAEEKSGLPEVIHIHYPLMVLSSEVFEGYKERGTKLIVTEHWSKVQNRRLDKYEFSQMRNYLNLADSYMAVGYKLKKSIIEITGTNRTIGILPNIVNDLFRLEERSHDGFRFGVVGRLSPEKQVDKIIREFAKHFLGRKNISLIIVGDGKERKKLEKLVKHLRGEDQIVFKGSKSRSETALIMKQLDCLISFSLYETFGVSIIEAWACGLPVITTTADSITDRWDDRFGISLGTNNLTELGKSMEQMLVNQFDRNIISDFALKKYSEDNVYSELMEIYRK